MVFAAITFPHRIIRSAYEATKMGFQQPRRPGFFYSLMALLCVLMTAILPQQSLAQQYNFKAIILSLASDDRLRDSKIAMAVRHLVSLGHFGTCILIGKGIWRPTVCLAYK